MKVLVEMSHELTECQVPSMVPQVMPLMLNIINDGSRGMTTRGRALQVCTYMLDSITVLKDFHKNVLTLYLDPYLQELLHKLLIVLQEDHQEQESIWGIKKHAISCLTLLVKNFRRRLSKYMTTILPVVWNNLTAAASPYVSSRVEGSLDTSFNASNQSIDSDGESNSLDAFIFGLFDFVDCLIEHHKTRKLLKQGMTDVFYYLVIYMQMNDEDSETWSTDASKFVEDEDEESYSYSVRVSAKDILLSLSQHIEDEEDITGVSAYQESLLTALNRHKEDCKNNWKILEASLLSLGSMSESLVTAVKSERCSSSLVASLMQYLECAFASLLTDSSAGNPFLIGRLIWTAGRFTPLMNSSVIQRFLEFTANSYSSPSHVIKIFATKSVYSFCSHLKEMKQESLMTPYLPSILNALLSLGSSYPAEVLILVLDTLSNMTSIDPDFVASHHDKMIPLVMSAFLANASDPVVILSCQDIVKQLAKNPKCISSLETKTAPLLKSIIEDDGGSGSSSQESRRILIPAALDILSCLVRGSPLPFSDTLLGLYQSTVKCLLSTIDDSSLFENGGECFRLYVSRQTQQIMSFSEGPSIVMRVCLHLLDPRLQESSSPFLGKVISTAILKGSSYLPKESMDLLLRSLVSKLQSSETLTVIQSLILVFAQLINHDMTHTLLDFLNTLPSPSMKPDSQSALHFILNLWLSRQQVFFGSYERKISITALGKLLETSVDQMTSGVDNNNITLNNIMVSGDAIVEETEKIITRSASKLTTKKVNQWTSIPASVKIFKLLINEIEEEEEEEDDSDDDSYDDDEESFEVSEEHRVLNISNARSRNEEDDTDSDIDEDELNDPVRKINLNHFILNFLKSFSGTPVFPHFVTQLNDNERQVLHKLQQKCSQT